MRGKHFLITGGGSGLGRALASVLVKEGALVSICGRRQDQLEETARMQPDQIKPFPFDVSVSVDVEDGLREIELENGPLDGLVNNAAVFPAKAKVGELSVVDWDEAFAINVRGAFLLLSKVIPEMKERGYGRILNVSAPLKHFPGASAYCASKCALDSLTKATAFELRGSGVLVNAVEPPMMNTEMHQGGADPEEIAPQLLEYLQLPEDGPTGRVVKIES